MTAPSSASAFVERWAGGNPPPGVLFPEPAFVVDGAVGRRASGAWAPLSESELSGWAAWLSAHGAGDDVLAGVRAFADAGTLCVVTGQQAGFALGPLYVLAKALAAVRLAREVAASTGRACVPVFWVASDDHDVAEAAAVSWRDAGGGLMTDALGTDREGAPVHDIEVFPTEAERLAQRMAPADGAFRALLLDSAVPTLGRPATIESSFVRLLLRVLRGSGIVPVAPRLGFIRERQAVLLERELALDGAPSRELALMRAMLSSEFGVDSIHREGDELNFFMEEGASGSLSRSRMKWDRGAIRVGDNRSITSGELRAMLSSDPGRFSPNAAMRPLAQDLALPTVAYVGGPSEVVYHAQIGPLYGMLGVARPAVFPRPSICCIDARMRRDAARLGLDAVEAAKMSRGELESKLAAGATGGTGGEPLAARLLAAAAAWESDLGPERTDTAVSQGLAKLRENIAFLAGKAEERAAAARARRSESVEAAARRLRDAIHPGGQPQERVQNLLLQWHQSGGDAWVEGILASLDIRSTAVQPFG